MENPHDLRMREKTGQPVRMNNGRIPERVIIRNKEPKKLKRCQERWEDVATADKREILAVREWEFSLLTG